MYIERYNKHASACNKHGTTRTIRVFFGLNDCSCKQVYETFIHKMHGTINSHYHAKTSSI